MLNWNLEIPTSVGANVTGTDHLVLGKRSPFIEIFIYSYLILRCQTQIHLIPSDRET